MNKWVWYIGWAIIGIMIEILVFIPISLRIPVQDAIVPAEGALLGAIRFLIQFSGWVVYVYGFRVIYKKFRLQPAQATQVDAPSNPPTKPPAPVTAPSSRPVAAQSAATLTTEPPAMNTAHPTNTERQMYADIADELDTGNRDRSLWTKAFAECDGDESRTRAAYIRYRAIEMQQPRAHLPEQVEQVRPSVVDGSAPSDATNSGVTGYQSPSPWGLRSDVSPPRATIEIQAHATHSPLHEGASSGAPKSRVTGYTAPSPWGLRSDIEPAQNRISPVITAGIALAITIAVLVLVGTITTTPNAPTSTATVGSKSLSAASPEAQRIRAQRLQNYAARYKIPSTEEGDETRLVNVTATGNELNFRYELTPAGQRARRTGRFVSDDELRDRMAAIACSDPERRELLGSGALVSLVLYRPPAPDFALYLGPESCK